MPAKRSLRGMSPHDPRTPLNDREEERGAINDRLEGKDPREIDRVTIVKRSQGSAPV